MKENDDIVLSVRNVAKCFEMYAKPVHRLYQTLFMGHKQFYKEFWALKDISFEVRKGECVGIIGRNGAGKSTLLQIITGTLAPTAGAVSVKGRVAALLELGSGFNPEFTGRENVYLNGSILGLSKKEIDERYDDIIAFADIGEFIDQPVKTYSSGMMVRLAFAVIAHVDADILIIDEALSVGDAFFQQKCMRFMRSFIANHTVLFVSHDTAAVTSFCQRAVLLDGGRMVRLGLAKDIVKEYMKSQVAREQDIDGTDDVGSQDGENHQAIVYRDMRADLINESRFRNDIEIFEFDRNSESYGDGQAWVESVTLADIDGEPYAWIVGGELVCLNVVCKSAIAMSSPIVGFILRDHLGQNLFGDNTFLAYCDRPFAVEKDSRFCVKFEFRMPYIPAGDYSICVAIAEGTQDNHVQHQWINDALMFKSHSKARTMGLVGVPMHAISFEYCHE